VGNQGVENGTGSFVDETMRGLKRIVRIGGVGCVKGSSDDEMMRGLKRVLVESEAAHQTTR
jgi:hypothetical protein